MGNTRKFWTRQVPQVWETIQNKGEYVVKKEYIEMKNGSIAPIYVELYRWYTREARNYISIPEELEFPIWMCLSAEYMLQPVEHTIILELEIPEEYYLISNYESWGYRVNYFYVPENPEDEKQMQKELQKYGIASEDELFLTDKGNFYPLLKSKVQKSWKRVFTMLHDNPANNVGTCWKIKREWVKAVYEYGE